MNTSLKSITGYQCPGCVAGPAGKACPRYEPTPEGCENHCVGTLSVGVGPIALGLPNGFTRMGLSERRKVEVFSSPDFLHKNLKTIYSVVVWKYLDEHGNTICRAFSPRTNAGWSFVVEGDHRALWPNAIEISEAEIKYMD